MNIRKLTGLELQQARYIWSQSFERGDRAMEEWNAWEERTPNGKSTYGIFEASALTAAFLLVDESIHLGRDTVLPMSAVCGVGVLPASRGRGYATCGVPFLFERMRESGRHISFLEPFHWEFYGRLGYAWTAPTRKYTVPTTAMASSPETEHVRAASAEDRPGIIECYSRFSGGYRGMLVRKPEVWDWRFDASKKEATYTYLYERGNGVEGYLFLHGGKRKMTQIDELIARTPRALQGLLGLLRRHEMQTEKFQWDAPADDNLWSTLMSTKVETKIFSRTMARIIDVAGALQALSPSPDLQGVVALKVVDETAPWNARTWRVECESGALTVSHCHDEAQVSITIQALTQAFLGSPTLSLLRAAGQVIVHDEAAFDVLASLLGGPPAWCNDGF